VKTILKSKEARGEEKLEANQNKAKNKKETKVNCFVSLKEKKNLEWFLFSNKLCLKMLLQCSRFENVPLT
jgi:hypothetical protein